MKKLFTLLALLTCFLGAKAQEWNKVYEIDYTTYQGFPFYVMGYVPEFDNGWMTDFGANYKYAAVEGAEETSDVIVKTQAGVEYYRWTEGGGWHQYFIADGINSIIDGKYRVVALVKASEATSINVNMGWGWGNGESVGTSVAIPQADDFQEVEWQYEGIGGTSCNLVAQPGTGTAIIEWKSLVVYEKKEEGGREKVWAQTLTNGDAEAAWPAWALETTDGINTTWRGNRSGEVCAYALTMGRNFDDQCPADLSTDSPRSRPYPADIEEEEGNTSNHVFAAHVTQVDVIDTDASITWSNQFWIESPKEWKAGTKIKLHFRYKAKTPVTVSTQSHLIHPSIYKGGGIGDLNFTSDWQTYDKEWAIPEGAANLTFNLSQNMKKGETNDFYFDDLSWEYQVLDEGYFVSGVDLNKTKEYSSLQLDDAVQFEAEDEYTYVATFGTKGDKTTYVDQVMISTVRGDAQAFKGATLKPEYNPKKSDPDEWISFAAASNSKIDLPGLGVWKIYIDTEYNKLAFEMLEGTAYEQPDPVDIVTNPTEIIIEAVERQPTSSEEDGGTGNTWDNQFFLYSSRDLAPGEETIIEFEYKAAKPANSSAAFQGIVAGNTDYITGAFNLDNDDAFDTEWKSIKKELTMPDKKWDGTAVDAVKFITFDLACIKEANTYTFKNIKWYLKGEDNANNQTLGNLINATGTENFGIKIGAGTDPYQYGTDPSGISTLKANGANNAAIYNLAGQKVGKDFKGIVVKSGKKMIQK